MRSRLAGACAALFVVTAVLVDAGVFHGVDQYAVSHLMPWLHPRPQRISSLLLPGTHGPLARRLVDLWIYPAAFVTSGVIVALCAWRGRSLVWPAIWVAANATELAGKLIVERPALFHHGVHVTAFDQSLPSGHTMRSLVAAAALAATWHWGRWTYAWALTVPFALVALGDHAPLDCVAGLFAAAALVVAAPRRFSHGDARVP